MKPFLYGICTLLLAKGALAQDATAVYAEDILSEQAQAEAAELAGCPSVSLQGMPTLTTAQADALLCNAVQRLPLALRVAEYGCTDRSEIIIGAFLQSGVPYEALGRVSSFFDTAKAKGEQAFVLQDPAHGNAFGYAWQMVFGTEFPRTILLKGQEDEIKLDVDGEIRWDLGHIAPTVWVVDAAGQPPQLRVIDPVLSPSRSLTVTEWRKLQNAPDASIVWGALGEPPLLLAEYMPAEVVAQWRKMHNMGTADAVEPQQMDAVLRALPPETRAETQAQLLDIAEKSAWHPSHWQGYSFTGGQGDLHEWKPNRPDITDARLQAAVEKLKLLNAYSTMRAESESDEAFLEEVKARLLKRNKDPKEVIIYLDEMADDAAF